MKCGACGETEGLRKCTTCGNLFCDVCMEQAEDYITCKLEDVCLYCLMDRQENEGEEQRDNYMSVRYNFI